MKITLKSKDQLLEEGWHLSTNVVSGEKELRIQGELNRTIRNFEMKYLGKTIEVEDDCAKQYRYRKVGKYAVDFAPLFDEVMVITSTELLKRIVGRL